MVAVNKIRYVKRRDLDVSAWNNCISKASNGLIYARSHFLDVMCTNWDALVLNDYESVMPLPRRKKWGFYYIYPPYFIPCLGVFGNNLNSSIVRLFLNQVPERFKYWEIDLNEKNEVDIFPKLKSETRKNIFLSLNSPYEVLLDNYRRLAKRKLAAALENGLTIRRDAEPAKIIRLYENYYEQNNRIIPAQVYIQLQQLFAVLPEENFRTYLVEAQNEIAAFYIVLVDQNNVYSLIGGSTENGKKHGAFYMATDAAIKDFAGSRKTFRFEGSDKKGIAFFNLQFGSFEVDYLRVTMNNLPWPLKYFK